MGHTLKIEDLIALGERRRAAYLLEQSGYTLGIAAGDGPALEGLLRERYLDAVRSVVAEVKAAAGDKTLMAEEAKAATRAQNEALRDSKIWRRRVVSRGRQMKWLGQATPDTLTAITRAKGVPEMSHQLGNMTTVLAANADAMGGEPARNLLEQGRGIAVALGSADADQEVKRLAALPAKVREFYACKGRLYVGLKVINSAGHELHAADPEAAAHYNLRILYRRAGAKRAATDKT